MQRAPYTLDYVAHDFWDDNSVVLSHILFDEEKK